MIKYLKTMKACPVCGEKKVVSQSLGACRDCLLREPALLKRVEETHKAVRLLHNLPPSPPRGKDGIPCGLCANACLLAEGKTGFCGARMEQGGKVVPKAGEGYAIVDWYKDPLPTNCVADWVCPGGSRSGYPRFSYSPSAEVGYYNLAVFFGACSFDCLFCQNWHYRELTRRRTIHELAQAVDERVSCICYFGGDPTPQIDFALEASRLALKRKKGRILRICWETNGSVTRRKLKEMAEISLESGGCIKVDIKAWTKEVYLALTGTEARDFVLENVAYLAQFVKERPDPPFLIASTLLVPGYVDEEEVKGIAEFLASLNKEIPYALLAFYPQFRMDDLPTTSSQHAKRCLETAKAVGLTNVRVGNVHLLAPGDYLS